MLLTCLYTINKSYVVGVYLDLLLKLLEKGEIGQQREHQAGSGKGNNRLDLILPTVVKPSQFMLVNDVKSRI